MLTACVFEKPRVVKQIPRQRLPSRRSTARVYLSWLHNYILPEWGNKPISEIRPLAVEQRLMRHSDNRTTMKTYGDAVTADMQEAQEKVVRLALPV